MGDSFPGAGSTSGATRPFSPRPQHSALLELPGPRPGGTAPRSPGRGEGGRVGEKKVKEKKMNRKGWEMVAAGTG